MLPTLHFLLEGEQWPPLNISLLIISENFLKSKNKLWIRLLSKKILLGVPMAANFLC